MNLEFIHKLHFWNYNFKLDFFPLKLYENLISVSFHESEFITKHAVECVVEAYGEK